MATLVSNIRPLLPLLLVAIFAACNPEVAAYTEGVEISINVEQVSAGFAQVRFSTNKEAFYLISIQPTQEGIDPQKIAKTLCYCHWIAPTPITYTGVISSCNNISPLWQTSLHTPCSMGILSISSHCCNPVRSIGYMRSSLILRPINQQASCSWRLL